MKTIIYGIGKLAEYADYVITNDSENEVYAFCINKDEFKDLPNNIYGKPLIDIKELESNYPSNLYNFFIAVGDNSFRETIFNKLKSLDYGFINYISSKSIYWDNLKLGSNIFIGEGSVIQPFVEINDNTIIFGSKIGHHCKIGKNIILSGTFIGGNVSIADNSFLGLNSTIKQNLSIGRKNIIGMGSIIEKNTSDFAIYHNGKSTKKRDISSEKFDKHYLK